MMSRSTANSSTTQQCIHAITAAIRATQTMTTETASYCYNEKHYFFRRILISRFTYLENLLHFNFADFPVNFIAQFVFCFFWCLKQVLLSKLSRIIVYII